jgi:hypothetical protein
MNKSPTKGETPSKLIDARIKELDDWRGKTLAPSTHAHQAGGSGRHRGMIAELCAKLPVAE